MEALATYCRLHFRSIVKVRTLRKMSYIKLTMDLSNPVLPALNVCGSPVIFNISFPLQAKWNMLGTGSAIEEGGSPREQQSPDFKDPMNTIQQDRHSQLGIFQLFLTFAMFIL